MRASETLYALFLQHRINSTTGAAIGIGDKDVVVLRPVALNLFAQLSRYLSRPVMKTRVQTLYLDVAPTIHRF